MEAASTSEMSVTIQSVVHMPEVLSINTAVRTLYLADYPYFLITNKNSSMSDILRQCFNQCVFNDNVISSVVSKGHYLVIALHRQLPSTQAKYEITSPSTCISVPMLKHLKFDIAPNTVQPRK